MPKDIAELRAQYEIEKPEEDIRKNYDHKEPEDLSDIKSSVVFSTIMSSMCCKEDKTNWAFHLFKIYQQYEDSLLRKVLISLRRSKMISVKKKQKKMGTLETDQIPLNANPYQLRDHS